MSDPSTWRTWAEIQRDDLTFCTSEKKKGEPMSDDKRPNRPDNDPPRPDRAKPEELRDWETVQRNAELDETERLRIVGGWLYRTVVAGTNSVAMVFVPAPDDDV